ncbi:transposase domain protein [Mycobacterium kansasii 732]|nr:transposase domain protein [Mycobacterium kansasii 732]
MVAYVRTVKTSSGATAVQIVWSSRRGAAHARSSMWVLPTMSPVWRHLEPPLSSG